MSVIKVLKNNEELSICPLGTLYRQIPNKEWLVKKGWWTYNPDGNHIEVDFSKVKPVLPTKFTKIPPPGHIKLKNGSYLVDISPNAMWIRGTDNFFYRIGWGQETSDHAIDPQLPETIDICSKCLKEVCTCKHESGYYWTKMYKESPWEIRSYSSEKGLFIDNHECRNHQEFYAIDWAPITRKDD